MHIFQKDIYENIQLQLFHLSNLCFKFHKVWNYQFKIMLMSGMMLFIFYARVLLYIYTLLGTFIIFFEKMGLLDGNGKSGKSGKTKTKQSPFGSFHFGCVSPPNIQIIDYGKFTIFRKWKWRISSLWYSCAFLPHFHFPFSLMKNSTNSFSYFFFMYFPP